MALTKLNYTGQGTVPIASIPTITSAKMPTGSVIQTVTTVETNSFSTSSGTYADIISKAITPSSTSSKILIMAVIHGSDQTSNVELKLAIHRDGTALTGEFNSYAASAGWLSQAIPCIELDSPSTTSEVTYSIKGKVGAGSGTVSSGAVCTLTLLEIAG